MSFLVSDINVYLWIMIQITDMPRGNPSSSRKRFFQQHIFQDNHTIEDEHGLAIQRTSIYENTSNDDLNIGIYVQLLYVHCEGIYNKCLTVINFEYNH